MASTPINHNIVRQKITESKLPNIGRASIREIKALINAIEKETGEKFIRMEMGVPGLPAAPIGVESEIAALKKGVATTYPEIEGLPELKREMARFIKLFMDISVSEKCIIPVTGSTSGSFISFLTAARVDETKEYTLFLDPGFPVHKQQLNVLGLKQMSLDVYDYRGERLYDKLDSMLSSGNVSTLLYSNPNNPTWICFSETELKIIAALCKRYNVIPIEDLAYFKMDFRKKHIRPGEPPFQPTIARYTDDYILLVSSSKIFSYAGQRIGTVIISDKLFNTEFEGLKRFYTSSNFGHAFVYGAAYAVSAGVTHSSQYALAGMLKAVNNNDHNFIEQMMIYAERAHIMKRIFTENGFKIVYDKDDDVPIADGFYFTVSYYGYSGEELLEELLYYGISAISLSNTGSTRKEGIRACVSFVSLEQMPELERRLKLFNENHSS